jgi:hypothetical protein
MKRTLTLVFILLLALGGCAMPFSYVQSPAIMFDNLSTKLIKNINGVWVGRKLVAYRLLPGQGSSESFGMRDVKEFYGQVHLTWENEAGQKFEKNFIFSETDLPISEIEDANKRAKMKDYTKADYVKFEFTQDGVEFYTSYTPGGRERSKNSGKIKNQIRQEYLSKKK